MPRPANGYRNAAGQQVPGCSDISGRFKDGARLLYWAFNRGKAGHEKLYSNELNIGTTVHMMAELDLGDRAQSDIDFYLETSLRDPEDRIKAVHAFNAFRRWRQQNDVSVLVQEVSMVSEALQFGGTIDNVALFAAARRRGVDFKTSTGGEIYPDHVLQIAGYDILWHENHPDQELDGWDLVVLPKNGDKPVHAAFTREQLHPFRQQFWLLRKAFEYDQLCRDPKRLKGAIVNPEPKVRKPRRAAPKPPPGVNGETMADILRRYGHVGAAA